MIRRQFIKVGLVLGTALVLGSKTLGKDIDIRTYSAITPDGRKVVMNLRYDERYDGNRIKFDKQ